MEYIGFIEMDARFGPWGPKRVRVKVRVQTGISFLKTVNTLLSESTEGRTRHNERRALRLGFKYISLILKGCEQTLNSVDSHFIG